MVTMQDLPGMKEKILNEIKLAAQNKDIRAITKWSKAAEQCEKFIFESTELERQVRDFGSALWSRVERPPVEASISPKQQGAIARDNWVKMLSAKQIQLTGHGKRYHNERGTSIGIAFANELNRPHLADKWFLGLKDEPIKIAVLLCQDQEGNLHDFIIPVTEIATSWRNLSRSGGEVKFHIERRKNEFFLLVPGSDPESITNYIGKCSLLASS